MAVSSAKTSTLVTDANGVPQYMIVRCLQRHEFRISSKHWLPRTEASSFASKLHISARVGPRAMKILPVVYLNILNVTLFMVKVARMLKFTKMEDYSLIRWNPSGFL